MYKVLLALLCNGLQMLLGLFSGIVEFGSLLPEHFHLFLLKLGRVKGFADAHFRSIKLVVDFQQLFGLPLGFRLVILIVPLKGVKAFHDRPAPLLLVQMHHLEVFNNSRLGLPSHSALSHQQGIELRLRCLLQLRPFSAVACPGTPRRPRVIVGGAGPEVRLARQDIDVIPYGL